MSTLLIIVGAALLYLGGDLLVRNASRLAESLGVTPLVIGLTVVAFGTSSPELAATLTSAFRGAPELVLGNVIGSNIANVGLILGLTALFYPLQGGRGLVARELPLMLLVLALTFPMLYDGQLGRTEALMLLALLGAYLVYQFRKGDVSPEVVEETAAEGPIWRFALGAVAGILLLLVGAQALVEGAVVLARSLGISERVIGLTLVALGTSLPELASSLVAALRREGALILGSIVGSSIFNVLAILGLTVMVRPIVFPFAELRLDLGVMLVLSALVWPLMRRGWRLGRGGGAVLLGLYGLYVGYLFIDVL